MPCKNFTRHFFTIYILIDYYLNKKTISVREKFDNTLPSPLHIPGGLFLIINCKGLIFCRISCPKFENQVLNNGRLNCVASSKTLLHSASGLQAAFKG